MKKIYLLIASLPFLALASCNKTGYDEDHSITICCSLSPHQEILDEAVKPLLEKKGYNLETKVTDWTTQNNAVAQGDYDANFFQHRPYLQEWETGKSNYSEEYVYTTIFPAAAVHFEPLRIYPGVKTAAQWASNKTTATYVICNDSTNETRALDLLVENGVISNYEKDNNGNPINLPSNITPVAEEMLAQALSSYDYGVLPVNTALTGNIQADTTLPVEGENVADLRANVLAARVSDYANNEKYKAKIDVIVEALMDPTIATYIANKYNNVIAAYQRNLLK